MSGEVVIAAERRRAYVMLAEDSQAIKSMAFDAFFGRNFLNAPTEQGTHLDSIASKTIRGLKEGFTEFPVETEFDGPISVLEDHIKDLASMQGAINPDLKMQLANRIDGRISAIRRLEMHNIDFDAAEKILNAIVNRLVPDATSTLPSQARR
jgi:hypothetical protein